MAEHKICPHCGGVMDKVENPITGETFWACTNCGHTEKV